jgi:hypothetical protein
MPARLFLTIACGFVTVILAISSASLCCADDERATPQTPVAAKQIEFNRDIRPIFAARCYDCHGPEAQDSGLRLDRKSRALLGGDAGVVIVPGKSDESLLLRYISGADPDIIMPPEGEGDPLTKEQIELFRAWIDQGAVWPADVTDSPGHSHWAFQRLQELDPPEPQRSQPVRNPIDAFVLSRLEEEQIAPSPEANRYTLMRRLSLDLIGLPPKPSEADEFVWDESAKAYENLVDRMLDSPHFGERWGRHWLDAARYADSDGYEKDRPRPNAWRYRDWVIEAVNHDMPFDQFTTEQLAGDLLPDATPMQKLATAFHRQTLTNTEGGTDKEQFRVEAVFDRVETTGTVWLGLTIGCARCHSHKYDPITQREYYGLFAFLNNGDEVDANVPISKEAVEEYHREKIAHSKKSAELEDRIAQARASIGPAQQKWEADIVATLDAQPVDPVVLHPLNVVTISGPDGVKFRRLEDASYLVEGTETDEAVYSIVAQTDLKQVTGFQIEALDDPSLPDGGPGRGEEGGFALSEFKVVASSTEDFQNTTSVLFTAALSDDSDERKNISQAFDGDKKTGWSVSKPSGKSRTVVLIARQPIDGTQATWFKLALEQQQGKEKVLGRFRIMVMTGTHPEGIVPKGIRNILAAPANQRDPQQQENLTSYYVEIDPTVSELAQKLQELTAKAPKDPQMSVRVISQRTDDPRKTHVLHRGDFLQPAAEVQPASLDVLHPFKPRKEDRPTDRLDLAHWLISPENPLTPRVGANDIWQHLFGRGLVATVNDFGTRGDRPSHPRLLDWLATEYKRLGWSRKALIKRIVMSATYRQSSAHRPELDDVDPGNMLLYRQNRLRIEGEIVRDVTLAVAGLLSTKIGGPSVFPPMPPDVAALSYNNSFEWKNSSGADRYRRGMYTFFKRTAPHPNLLMFDCPDSNTTCVQRRSSNTPLQALTTLNNETFVEASQALVRRIFDESPSNDSDRISNAYRLCLTRPPTVTEKENLLELLAAARNWYENDAESAKSLAGDFRSEEIAVTEVAAWVATIRILINLDEFITRE